MVTDARRGGGSLATIVKQQHFEKVVAQELRMAWAAINARHDDWRDWHPRRVVLVFDLNGGPGYISDDEIYDETTGWRISDPRPSLEDSLKGSPLLTLRAALDADIPLKLVVCEKNPAFCRSLKEALIDELQDWALDNLPHDGAACDGCSRCDRWKAEDRLDTMVTILEGDHTETIPAFLAQHRAVFASKRPFFGLIYADPYGAKGDNGLPVGPLEHLTRVPCLRRLEVLINVSATAYKRTRHLGAGELFDELDAIHRDHRWVREPVTAWQWTMILATNSPKVRPNERLGFHRFESDAGRSLIDRLSLSKAQRKGA